MRRLESRKMNLEMTSVYVDVNLLRKMKCGMQIFMLNLYDIITDAKTSRIRFMQYYKRTGKITVKKIHTQ